jgi:hypothetical protein
VKNYSWSNVCKNQSTGVWFNGVMPAFAALGAFAPATTHADHKRPALTGIPPRKPDHV